MINTNKNMIFAGIIGSILVLSFGAGFVLDTFSPSDTIENNDNEQINEPFKNTDLNSNETFIPEIDTDVLDNFWANIQSGGPPPDGIPPVDNPKYWTVNEADTAEDFLSDWDIVFGLNYKGNIIAFPQKILVWHEIVNEIFGNEKITITYCPLTGSTIGFHGNISAGTTNFGTSGKLVNSNLVMYDRETDSFWPQIYSQSIQGDEKGVKLTRIHLTFTTWKLWKNTFPDTIVLNTDTGFTRNYGYDPYGSYEPGSNTYYQSGNHWFSVTNPDSRFDDKEVFYGIDYFNEQLAVNKNILKSEKVINTEVGNKSIVLIYDERFDSAKVYLRSLGDLTLNFTISDNLITDDFDNSWNIDGKYLDQQLIPVDEFFDVYWFAWIAFFPSSEVY